MADLGVDWPDLTEGEGATPPGAASATVDAAASSATRVVIEALKAVGDLRLRTRFDELSRSPRRDDAANLAQIDRRAREDRRPRRPAARLWLLRRHVRRAVEPDPATRTVVVTLMAEPGPGLPLRRRRDPGLGAAGARRTS
jgi:hypothetical protein